ncbi:ABC-2 type transport system ATP-binding protein [Micromonospora pallida]|uniref:ABC-2 type transport system ATP-binding protein n=1 Tax=Micromonospora pallida TaxID=145854 RepID=A0A1C6TCI5_9ACTN|nr:ATP-binding cassette domain-containing protein [Micromonospora pallida]SCL39399.1 ABC-2 type transport system ATP-binding protein [Micromonospora pallida]
MNSAITAVGLRKTYGDQTVLDGIDLTIAAGTVYALLGPNGAGKTTTVHILSTLVAPDAGTAMIAGHDLARDPDGVRAAIGLTGQFAAVDGLLTGEENLRLMARLRHLGPRTGRRRVTELLERFDLVEAARKPLATYSGGMKRRLDLAMTLVGSPKVIFLDEPTTGLDPRSRQTMWDIVRELLADGVTILLTTQYLEEADRVADRVAVLHRGRLVGEGSPAELKARVGSEVLIVHGPDGAPVREIPTDGTADGLRHALAGIGDVRSANVSVRAPSLDDVFFALTEATTTPTRENA